MSEDRLVVNGERAEMMFSAATAFAAEGARVGIVTCLRCGAAVFLSMDADSLTLHRAWHDAITGGAS